jgi:hypothetical protein
MRVLLCKESINTAGNRGDEQMQLQEKVKEGDEIGEYYGNRLIKIVINLGSNLHYFYFRC